jgi:hypothetical protein
MTTDSHIEVTADAMVFVGADAVALYRATALIVALRMYASCRLRANRAWTPSAMLRMAERFTGKSYKRGHYLEAANDVDVWRSNMCAALPVIHKGDS